MSIKELLKSADYGGIIGAGVNFGNIGAELKYALGFANINDIDDEVLKNGSFSAGVTLKF